MYDNQLNEQLRLSLANLQKFVHEQSQDIADLRQRVRELELENSENKQRAAA